MRNTIFNAIASILKRLDCLKGSDGTVRVYLYPNASPDGYPAVSLTSSRLESEVMDSSRDLRRYIFNIRLVQEKMPDYFGPEKGKRVAREREDEILAAFDNNNDLDIAGVLRITPLITDFGYIENNSRIVIDFTIAVEVAINVTP